MLKTLLAAGVCALAIADAARADTPQPPAPDPTTDEVLVLGQRHTPPLDRTSTTASRLGLSLKETPATVEVLTQDDMQVRGLRTSREAFNSVVGAIAGNVPGNPAVVTMRGFSGGAVSILQDGIRITTSTIATRDTNTWTYDRVEVIKGPASVLYGEGALAGTINKVTRKPLLDGDHGEAQVSYASFNTLSLSGDLNVKVTDDLAVRADASRLTSDSLYDVDHNRTRSNTLTASALYKPRQDLSVLLAVDHNSDLYDGTYQGSPLVPSALARDASDAVTSTSGMVLDKAMRHRNYNPDGAYSGANETTVRSHADYDAGGGWSLTNDLMWYTAHRSFVLAGDQNYTAPTAAWPDGSIARSVQRIYHDQDFWVERLALANQGEIAGRRNRFAVGGEYNETSFLNPRQQSAVGAVPNVDPYAPVVGSFPTAASVYKSTNVIYDSTLSTSAAFAEDALNITPSWLLIAGGRYDHIALDRTVTDLNKNGAVTHASPVFDPLSWRVGSTYDLLPNLTLYSQYTTAAVPVSSMLVQSIANTAFKLTTGRSVEAGVKASAFDRRATLTGAVYRITQSNILTRDPNNPTQSVQGGQQEGKGYEITLDAAVTQALRLTAGYAYTDARYTRLSELVGGVRISRDGNHPINTPANTINLSALYTIDDLGSTVGPVTLGAFGRYAGGFYTDTANTIFVRGHWTLDASISYAVTPAASVSLRGRNLTDAFYGEYSGYNANNIYIGAPRSVEATLDMKF